MADYTADFAFGGIGELPEPFKGVFLFAFKNRASDIHLIAESRPLVRIGGNIRTLEEFGVLTSDMIKSFAEATGCRDSARLYEGNELDYAFSIGEDRIRCNVYLDMHGCNLSMRLLTNDTLNFEKLGIPPILKELVVKKSGLILITGPTGSGKTTTLTCLLNYLNDTQESHIITIEDPIEYVHTNKRCIISQREVGRDTKSFGGSVEASLRQDPDIIMVGEMRDVESIAAAVQAAETGHLVLSTLHTRGSVNTVDRIIDVFPAAQQNQIRAQLAMVLLGVVSQQLIPGIDGNRYLATEVMLASNAVKNHIRYGKTHLIPGTIQMSAKMGMYLLEDSLERLKLEGKITEETANMYTMNN